MLGFKAFEAAQDTLVGIEPMHMIKKKQLRIETGDEGLTAAELFYSLAAYSPHRQGELPLHDLRRKICDTTTLRHNPKSTRGHFVRDLNGTFLASSLLDWDDRPARLTQTGSTAEGA